MKTDMKNLAAYLAAVIWADEAYEEAERVAVAEVAGALELDGLDQAVEAELALIKDMDGEAVSNYMVKAAEGVDDEEIAFVFEAVLQIALADGVLAYSEASNLLTVADALGLGHEYALLMVADMMKEEPEIEVDFD